MSDFIKGAIEALFQIVKDKPWGLVVLLVVVVFFAAILRMGSIIAATERLISIRRRFKDPDDWTSENSFLRVSDPVLWRQNLVFNRLRIDYANSDRLGQRISSKETPIWILVALIFVCAAYLWALAALLGGAMIQSPVQQSGYAAQSSTQQSRHTTAAPSSGIGSHFWILMSFALLLLMLFVLFCYVALLSEEDRGRRIRVLSLYLRDLGLSRDASRVAAKYWYHFAIEHPPTQIFTEDEVGDFVSLRLERPCGDHLLMRRKHVLAMRKAKKANKKFECPTCKKKVYSWTDDPKWWLRFNDRWNESDIIFAFAALSDLFRTENVEKYLRRHESRLERGGSAEAGTGGPEGTGGDDGAAGNGWFSRVLRRGQRRQPRPR